MARLEVRPKVSNLTTPSILAKSVWSLPMPTFSPGLNRRAALAHQDVSRAYDLSVGTFYAKPPTRAIAPITAAAAGFFLCHLLVTPRSYGELLECSMLPAKPLMHF